MGVVVFLGYEGIDLLMKKFTSPGISNALATLLAIVVGMVAYFVCLLLLKGLTKEELLRFPKGTLLVRIAQKLHLLK